MPLKIAPGAAPSKPAACDYFRTKWDDFNDESSEEESDPKPKPKPKPAQNPKQTPKPGPSAPPGFASLVDGLSAKTPGGRPAGITARLAETMEVVGGEEGPSAASEKERGNELFKKGEWEAAVACYSCSLALRPTAVAHANRAMALMKMKRLEEAETDCSDALALDDAYVKAYSRRGSARQGLKKYAAAVRDFEAALALHPASTEIQRQLAAAHRLADPKKPAVASASSLPAAPARTTPPSRKFPPLDGAAPLTTSPAVSAVQSNDATSASQALSDLLPGGTLAVTNRLHQETEATAGPTPVPAGTPSQSSREPAGPQPVEEREGTASLASQGAELVPGGIQIGAYARASPFRGGEEGGGGEAAMAAVARAQERMQKRVRERGGKGLTSWAQLERMWAAVGGEGGGEAKANILRDLDPLALPSLVGDQLVAPFLLDFLGVVLEHLWSSSPGGSIALLQSMTCVPRFRLTTMCFTTKDRGGLSEQWTKAQEEGERSHCLQLQSLRDKYRV